MLEKEIRQQVADELGHPIEVVEIVISNMWKRTKAAAKTEAMSLEIPQLGCFRINKNKIIHSLKRYKEYSKTEKGFYAVEKIERMLVKPIQHPEWNKGMDDELFEERKKRATEYLREMHALREERKREKCSNKG